MINLNNSIIKLGLASILFGQESFPNINITGTSSPMSNAEPFNWLDGEYEFSHIDKTGRPVYQKGLTSNEAREESKLFWHNKLNAWILSFNFYGRDLELVDSRSFQYISYENAPKPSLIKNWEPSFKENTSSNIEITENLM
jgi:hypothetical protein